MANAPPIELWETQSWGTKMENVKRSYSHGEHMHAY